MFRRLILSFVTLIAALAIYTPAQACPAVQFETHVMFVRPPAAAAEADFSGKVHVKLKKRFWFFERDAAHGYHAKVIESATHPEMTGKNIELPQIIGTSCGPFLDQGDKGFIFGKIVTSKSAKFKVLPQSQKGMMSIFQNE